jgi:type I restriction enzyme, S subunit
VSISVPSGWVSTKFDAIVDVLDFEREPINSSERSQRVEGKSRATLFPYYGATGQVGWIDEYRSDGERILLGEDAAPFLDPIKDKAYLANGRFWVNNHAHVLHGAVGLVNNRYLCHQLNHVDYHPFVSGSTRLKLTSAAMRQIPMLVAPAAEQTRIVAKLEELLSDLDAGVAELKAAQKKLGQYRQSLLKAAVEGADSGQPYPKLALGDLVKSIGQGWSPKCERESATDDEQWAVMKTTAIQTLAFDGAHNKALPIGLKPRVNLELQPGDLLVTRAGPRNRVGITCLVRKTRPKLILCDKAYRIRCDEERIDPSFLELVLNAPHMVQRIDELKTGISDSGLNLTQDRFFTLEIPLPTIAEQRTIVERINAQVALIQDQEQSIDLSLKQSAAQRKNILKAAFSGQLVPQDPNDEPASVLLERIRAERAERDAEKKPRGRKAKAIA